MDLKSLIEPVVALAETAGRAILEVYSTDFEVQSKADESPLTQADLAAHHRIVAGLQSLTPGLPIISEEDGLPDFDDGQRLDYLSLSESELALACSRFGIHRQQAMLGCLENMKPEQRRLVSLRYQPGVTVREMAAEAGKSPNAVSEQLRRIRDSLMECIQQKLALET